MKKNILLYTLVLIGTQFLGSCKKYLDKKPDTTLSTPTTLADLQALLDNVTSMNFSTTSSYMQASDDDYFLIDDFYDIIPEIWQKSYLWIPFEYTFGNDWNYGYRPIYNSNLCLDYIDKINRTGTNGIAWDNVKGSALFYRAYYFLELTWEFGKAYDENSANTDLGICLRLNSNFNEPSVRSSIKAAYDKLIADAKQAVIYLPDNPLHPSRPSKAAAYGLLARAYLSMRQYDSAFVYSNLCLGIKSNLLDYKTAIDVNASFPFKKYNSETIFYSDHSDFVTPYTISIAFVDTLLYNTYAANDMRKDAFFTPNSGYFSFKGMYTGNESSFFSGIATDEVYLIRAECYARKDNKDAAMGDLNTLLIKRYDSSFVSITAADLNDALSKILLERRKELLFRGLRWVDIKRLNKEGANITLRRNIHGQEYKLLPNSNYYALPLPIDIVNNDGIKQNP